MARRGNVWRHGGRHVRRDPRAEWRAAQRAGGRRTDVELVPAHLLRLGVLESFEPLGCELGTIWNEPRFAVVDAGFVVSTFQSTNETGILQLP